MICPIHNDVYFVNRKARAVMQGLLSILNVKE